MSDPKKTASIFDVLYADTRRLSSLLSQFSDDGIVTEITRAASESSSTGLGLSIKVLKSDSGETGSSSASRRIDPQWLLPLLFLDSAKDMIQRDITEAAVGSLVLSTGRLFITDLSILQGMWKSPAMKRQMLKAYQQANALPDEGNRQQRRGAIKPPKQDMTEQEAILEMLPSMPHGVQANILTEDAAVWSTIEPNYMVGSTADLLPKTRRQDCRKLVDGWHSRRPALRRARRRRL